MCRQSFCALFGTLALLLVGAGALRATDIREFRWNGSDLMIRFSDDVTHQVDLAASDSGTVIIRLGGRALGSAESAVARSLPGPNGMQAVITPVKETEVRLTIRSAGSIGYATLWRPYSHTLIVHTFGWDRLDYPKEQYYKGLLALEQGLIDAGNEMLEVARSTGDGRAASVLGVLYARAGNFKRAAPYLNAPVDADDYAALAEVQAHNGDEAGAAHSRERFSSMMAEGAPRSAGAPATAPVGPQASNDTPRNGAEGAGSPSVGAAPDTASYEPLIPGDEFESNDAVRSRNARRWMYIAGGIGVLLLLIWIVARMSRRGSGHHEEMDLDHVVQPTIMHDDAPIGAGPGPMTYDAGPPVEEHPADAEEEAEVQEAVVVSAHGDPEPTATPDDHGTTQAEVRQTEDERADHDEAVVTSEAPEAIITESTPPEANVPETVLVEPIVDAPEEAAEAEEATAHEAIPEATVVEPIDEASTTDAGGLVPASTRQAPTRSMPTQAADLRRKIEAMRGASSAETPEREEPKFDATTDESTIATARRLHLSRDTVELRRRMERARGEAPSL